MMVRYKTHGTCSTEVRVEVEKGLVKLVAFEGGRILYLYDGV